MFVDEVNITVTAGAGGHGCMSFRRERFIPRGGPDGGDGGSGGNILMQADASLNTLHHLAGKHHWKAKRGIMGMGKERHGKKAADVTIPVPPGTLIYDSDHDILLKDLTDPGDVVCVAKGGKGGKGNTRFKSATNQAPREFEEGEPGQIRNLHLELKLIADVALVGKPNAGKSTLLSRLSAAKPKIAAYPFTTLTPYLGIVELSSYRRFVMADIPGLIEGAHDGAGLGHEFLRHIERARTILHLVDICPMASDPAEDYKAIREELMQYSPALADKPEIVVANKMDITESDEHLAEFRKSVDTDVHPISAVTGKGLDTLGEKIWGMLYPIE
ncbi:MAG: GTPase ObgE [Phycisphaerae bacterium]|nr:GTPase ObgE [Phycisphaerae bacterium]